MRKQFTSNTDGITSLERKTLLDNKVYYPKVSTLYCLTIWYLSLTNMKSCKIDKVNINTRFKYKAEQINDKRVFFLFLSFV